MMKYFTKLWLIVIALCLFSTVEAQKLDRTIKLKVKKEINGEMTTIEKTYNSIEEMKNDPDLKSMDLKLKGGNAFFFSNDENSTVDIKIDDVKNGESDKNHFFFKIDGDENFEWSSEEHDIEVIKDEDGNVTVLKDGKPVEKTDNVIIQKYSFDDAESIGNIKIEKGDDGNKVIIVNG
ncbi:MAG: hypothetical protein AAFN93_05410, partial [Bacteroidota bacterium]